MLALLDFPFFLSPFTACSHCDYFLFNNHILLLVKVEAIFYMWKSKIMSCSFLKLIYNVKRLVTWFRALLIKAKTATTIGRIQAEVFWL